MKYKYNDKEIETLLKSLTIIMDTREKEASHIRDYLNKKEVPMKLQKLDHGDYGCMLPANPELGIMRDTYFDTFVERKAHIDEITGNLQQDKKQAFVNELIRAQGSRFVLLVEDKDGYEKMIRGHYRSKYNPLALLGTLNSLQAKYKFEMVYMDNSLTGNWIYHRFYYQVKHFLKHGTF